MHTLILTSVLQRLKFPKTISKTLKMTLIKSISGIRGTIGGKVSNNLTPIDTVKFAAAYGMWLKNQSKKENLTVVIGRDARISGKMVSSLVSNTLVGLGINVTQFSGAVELAPSLGKADFICDLVSSGQTLKAHNLSEGQTILKSTAVVIKSLQAMDRIQENWVNKLIERIQGVLQVKESKYIMMHAPRASIDSITNLLPGTESPTIIPLEGTNEIVALHVVCKENIFWETLEDLKAKGASSILVVPVEKMLM